MTYERGDHEHEVTPLEDDRDENESQTYSSQCGRRKISVTANRELTSSKDGVQVVLDPVDD